MAALHPYLNFNGNAEEAFNFYQSVFGGEFETVMRFKDVPAEYQMGESDGDKIMHMALPIGNGSMLMGSDVPEQFGKVTFGTASNISISADSEEDARKIFDGLSAGGEVTMPLDKAFWGDLFGMLKDKFGVHWMVGYSYGNQQG